MVLNTSVTERSVSLKKKKRKGNVFGVPSAIEKGRCCFSLAGFEARTVQLFSDHVYSIIYM